MYHSNYFGQSIWYNTEPGNRLRWSSFGLAADTLSGIRWLIRESLGKNK